MHILEYKINNKLNHSDLQPTQFPSTLEAHLAKLLHNSLELLAAAVHEGADEFDCVRLSWHACVARDEVGQESIGQFAEWNVDGRLSWR